MAYMGAQFMRDDPQLLSRRLAAFVSPIPAKDLARRIGCDVRTAENIRRGHWPVARHWVGLVVTFGRDLTEAVFHPEEAAARLEKEVADLERQLAEKAAQLQLVDSDARSFAPRGPKTSARQATGASALSAATPKGTDVAA